MSRAKLPTGQRVFLVLFHLAAVATGVIAGLAIYHAVAY